jgi:hypothetical protein
MVIKSYENHHVIIDKRGEILGYRYYIKDDLLRMLKEITKDLPHIRVNAGNQGNYPTCYYIVWHDYNMELYESAEYRKELPALKE